MEQRVQRLFGGSACAQDEGPKLKGRGAVCKEGLVRVRNTGLHCGCKERSSTKSWGQVPSCIDITRLGTRRPPARARQAQSLDLGELRERRSVVLGCHLF